MVRAADARTNAMASWPCNDRIMSKYSKKLDKDGMPRKKIHPQKPTNYQGMAVTLLEMAS
jgi:hypothetical protein